MIQFKSKTETPSDTITQQAELWSEIARRDSLLWDDLKRMNNLSPVKIILVRTEFAIYEWNRYEFMYNFDGYGTKKNRAEKVTDESKPVSTRNGRDRFRTQKIL